MRGKLLLAIAVSVPLIGLGSTHAEAFGCCDGWGYAPYYIYDPRGNCYVPQPPYRPSCHRRRACERASCGHHRGRLGWFHWW
jgi:hypothetical protein